MKKLVVTASIIVLILLSYFIFIPAFAGRLVIDPVLHLGLFQIHWYGVTLAAAILAAFFVIRRHAWKFGISVADIDDFSFWAVVVGLVGARLYLAIFSTKKHTGRLRVCLGKCMWMPISSFITPLSCMKRYGISLFFSFCLDYSARSKAEPWLCLTSRFIHWADFLSKARWWIAFSY